MMCAALQANKEKEHIQCFFIMSAALQANKELMFVAQSPSNMQLYLMDWSTQTILRAATLR